ncbi:basement membrane-specific heparan sulfate proteoglycan core protein-like [Alosa pseudoharengus]|uniref:basement membrane-specific heparan sulfate proteoglycan core protein-like n=1 Tax=Alosa pseudoharengus TaxID=34774 RepID=UPI003F8C6D7D
MGDRPEFSGESPPSESESNKQRSPSPALSLDSDDSKDGAPDFSGESPPSESESNKQRSPSPAPSLDSDHSKDGAPDFSGESPPSESESNKQRSPSPAPSLDSDDSKDGAPDFSGESPPSESESNKQRSPSPAPSLDSDDSKDGAPDFSGESPPSESESNKQRSPSPAPSLDSDDSKDGAPDFSGESLPSESDVETRLTEHQTHEIEQKPQVSPAKVSSLQWSKSGIAWMVPIVLAVLVALYAGFYHHSEELPLATLTVEPQSPVFTGETVTLKCVIESLSGWTYKWYEGSSSVPVSEGNTFTIRGAAESHKGQYWCQGERRDRPTSSQPSGKTTLDVKELPLATLTVEPQISVFIGETVTLNCVIESLSDWTYKWYEGSSRTPVSEGNTFTIIAAAEFHKGQYWCQGERRDRPTSSQRSGILALDVKEQEINMEISLQQPFIPELANTSSTRFKNLTADVSTVLNKMYSEKFGSQFLGTHINSIRPGSVVVDFVLLFKNIFLDTKNVTSILKEAVAENRPDVSVLPIKLNSIVHKPWPLATLTVEPQSPVFTGETVTLKCVIEYPSNWTYKWYEGSSRTPVSEGNTFTINGATESHKGQYWCRGERKDRPTLSQPSRVLTLYVKELPLATLTVEPQSPVFIGETVTLKCVIESLSGWTYKWYEGSSSVPVSEGNTFIIIAAAESHKGQYWCQGERRDRPTSSQPSGKTTLDVKELPLATLTIEPQSPVFTGETVTLNCVIESLSGWTYKWYEGSSSLPVSEGNTFTIRGATESHKGQYWCQGERRDRPTSSQPSGKTSLDVKELPLATLTVEPQSPVFTGETVTLKCVIESLSGWTYKWYEGSSRTPVSEGNTFTIRGAAESHKGLYWCQGERRDRPTSSQPSGKTTLDVKELPLATLTIEPQSPVFTGETVTLNCVIESLSGWTYKWYKGSSRTPVSEGNTFTINGATESHKGQYWCQGERRDRSIASQPSGTITLDVKELPLATLTVEPQSPVFIGETVTLNCVIESLSGWTYKWYKGSSRTAVSEGNTLTIIGAAESHKGQYWCQGQRRDRPTSSQPSRILTLDVKAELPLATLTVEPQSPVFIGETVTLKCVIESLSGWTYKWYERSSSVPVSEGNTFIIIAAAESPKGQYWCQGERRDRPTSSQPSGKTTLDVKELPLATLTVEPQSPVFVGETVTLKCVIESLSGWTYKWYEGSSSVPVSEGNTFIIIAAAESPKGQYWCQGERRDRPTSSQPSGKTTLDVKELPLATLTIEPQSPVFTGETVTLKCVIESLSDWTYKWYEGSSSVPVSEGNTFIIIAAAESHKGQYWCQGERRDRPTSSQPSGKTTLDVKELPLATLTVEPQSSVLTGETVTLKCVIESFSDWTYKLYKGPSRTPVSEGNTFTIKGATESHKGQYWCQGERRDRPTSSQPSRETTLDVKEPADIAFLMDGSWSVNPEQFLDMKTFVKDVTRSLLKFNTAFAFAQYSTKTSIHVTFHQFQRTGWENQLDSIKQIAGDTYTADAVRTVVKDLFDSSAGARPDAHRILIVLTDGRSFDASRYPSVTALADEKHITRYAIGIGSAFNSKSAQDELRSIASSPDHVFRVDNFEALSNIISRLKKSIKMPVSSRWTQT